MVEIIHLQDSISPPIPKCFQGKLLENWLSRVTYSPIYCLNKYPQKVKKDKVKQGTSELPASKLSPRGIGNKLYFKWQMCKGQYWEALQVNQILNFAFLCGNLTLDDGLRNCCKPGHIICGYNQTRNIGVENIFLILWKPSSLDFQPSVQRVPTSSSAQG